MEYSLFCLVLLMLWKSSASIRCYQCEPASNFHKPGAKLCQNFNGSDAFYVDCKDSTICFKKETSYKFGNELNVAVQRGCASQTMDGDQEKVNHTWKLVRRIYEVYNETCNEDKTDERRVFKTVNCYCRGDFCNGTDKLRGPIKILVPLGAIAAWIVTILKLDLLFSF